MPKILVTVNARGRRVGEFHPLAKLTESDVELMRRLHEEENFGYRRLAKMFEVGKTTVRRICKYEIWNQSVQFRFRELS